MSKKGLLVIALFVVVLMAGCDKEKIELRRTIYFYTEVNTLDDILTLYNGDENLGQVPYVENGITSFSNKEKGLKITIPDKESHFTAKNISGDVVVEFDFITNKYSTKVKIETTIGSTNTFIDDTQGILLGLNPKK